MSQSPLVPGKSEKLDKYLESWSVLNRLIDKGGSFSGHERNCCFLNTGKKPFANVSATSGIDWADDTRGVAIVDWDRDGDLDFWATNRTAPRVRLMRNNAPPQGRFLSLRLKGTGTHCNRDAIGARVELWSKPSGEPDTSTALQKRIKTLSAGSGFLSQSSKWIHFGLPPNETIVRVEVHWPDGQHETLKGLQPGTFYHVVQGEGTAEYNIVRQSRKIASQLMEGQLLPPEINDAQRIVLARRQLLPEMEYTNLTGESVKIDSLQSPLLINLWADWCRPCIKELGEFVEQRKRLEKAGLRVVALHVGDPEGNREDVAKVALSLLKRLKFSQASGIADVETIKLLDTICDLAVGLHRELPVPSSFLIDRSGRVCVIYKGPVTVDQLLKDVASIGGIDEKFVETAATFAGTWHRAPTSYESLEVARRLLKQGRGEEAVDFLIRCIDYAKQLAIGHQGPDTSLASMYHILGTVYRTTDRLPQAILNYQKALQVDPDHWLAHFDLGTIYLKKSPLNAAEEHFAAALRIKPDDADMLYKMALVQVGLKRFKKAVIYLEKALVLAPQNQATLRIMATVQLNLMNSRQAIPHLIMLLKLQPGNAPLCLELGHALNQIGRRRDALLQYRRAMELRTNWIPPMNAAAWLLATQDNPSKEETEEAVKLAEKVCQIIGRPQPSALDTLAAALAACGRFTEAIEIAEKALGIAEQGKAEEFTAKLRDRLHLYRQQQPYRE